jgi:hypothetical protein
MRPKPVVFFTLVVLPAVCLGQWSEPADVGIDTTLNSVRGFQLVAAGGDTLWSFYNTFNGFPETDYVLVHWSMGDSWSAPETLAADRYVWCLSAGVDPQRQLWLSWYNGDYLILGDGECLMPSDTWGIWTRLHDSVGWGYRQLALLAFTDFLEAPEGLSFAADKHGNWYMGICEDNEGMPYPASSALYSRFQGDTWTWPSVIAAGSNYVGTRYGLPSLVARPDTGLWAVYSSGGRYYESYGIDVAHLIPSSVVHLATLGDMTWATATGDSGGQMWIIAVDTLGTVWSITYDVWGEIDRRIVTTDHRWADPQVCTDPLGWIWVSWTLADTTLVVSYNQGRVWSQPETVTSKRAFARDIVSDDHGRVCVGFCDTTGKYWTCYRTSRPGIAGPENDAPRAGDQGAAVVRALPPGTVTFDAMGRRVANPSSGIYFVREAQAQTVRKVIIQH